MSDEIKREEDGGLVLERENQLKPPKMYKVLLHNDDYTTMEFVIYILQKIFHKSLEESQSIMLKIHNEGVGVCGIYTYEIAETKVAKVTQEAKGHEHPLKCTMELED